MSVVSVGNTQHGRDHSLKSDYFKIFGVQQDNFGESGGQLPSVKSLVLQRIFFEGDARASENATG